MSLSRFYVLRCCFNHGFRLITISDFLSALCGIGGEVIWDWFIPLFCLELKFKCFHLSRFQRKHSICLHPKVNGVAACVCVCIAMYSLYCGWRLDLFSLPLINAHKLIHFNGILRDFFWRFNTTYLVIRCDAHTHDYTY